MPRDGAGSSVSTDGAMPDEVERLRGEIVTLLQRRVESLERAQQLQMPRLAAVRDEIRRAGMAIEARGQMVGWAFIPLAIIVGMTNSWRFLTVEIALMAAVFLLWGLRHHVEKRRLRRLLTTLSAHQQADLLRPLAVAPHRHTRGLVRALLRELPITSREPVPSTAPTSRGDEPTPAGDR